MRGSRIFRVIDAVSEAWDLFFLRQHALHIVDRIRVGLIDGCKNWNTASLAPPCNGPLRAPIAEVIAECMSDKSQPLHARRTWRHSIRDPHAESVRCRAPVPP